MVQVPLRSPTTMPTMRFEVHTTLIVLSSIPVVPPPHVTHDLLLFDSFVSPPRVSVVESLVEI